MDDSVAETRVVHLVVFVFGVSQPHAPCRSLKNPQIQQSVLGDDHPTVASTMESMDLVETAKHCAENPASPAATLLMNGAESVCNAAAPTNITQMLGFNSSTLLSSFAPRQWFPNPCAPTVYTEENGDERKNAGLDTSADSPNAVDNTGDDDGSASSSSSSSSSDEDDEAEDDVREEAEEFEVQPTRMSC